MKVLFTGMASSHCAPSENVSFFNTLAGEVAKSATVVWSSPKLSWTKSDLESYDAIFLGFIPPTALSANKIYGAMHVLGLMFDSPKLNLVADGGQIWQYKNSIESVKRDVSGLFASFYSKRLDYAKARDPKHIKSIVNAAEKMSSSVWPRVIYPTLPWQDTRDAFSKLGFGSIEGSVGLNLDSSLLSTESYGIEKTPVWAVDNLKSQWYRSLSETLAMPGTSMKLGRASTDIDAEGVIRSSAGVVVTPQERNLGTWWSYRYAQSLSLGTPIVTYWQDTYSFDPSWAFLGYQIEDMGPLERRSLSRAQYDSYLDAIPNKTDLTQYIKSQVLDSIREMI